MISFNRNALKVFLLFLTLSLTSIHPVLAADPTLDPPPETQEEAAMNHQHNDLLFTRNYAELDKEMNHIQSEYEAGNIDDIKLRNISYAFYDSNPALEVRLTEWVNAYPKSYAAHVARGIYYRRLARTTRGTNTIDKTTGKQINLMHQHIENAMLDFSTSLDLTKKPLLTLYNMINVARLVGDKQLAEDMMREANMTHPNNFIVTYKYLSMLQGRWGGSLVEMEAYRKTINNDSYAPELLKIFDDLMWEEKNWVAEQKIKGFSRGIK